MIFSRYCLHLVLTTVLLAGPVGAQLSSRTTVERDFLNYGNYNPYRNHAFEPFRPFPVFGWSAPRYDRLGRYVMQGRVMVSADEERPGLSRVQGLRFETANVYAVGLTFNYTVLQDSYQGRSYAMMVVLGSDKVETTPVKTRFSPLTLNMTRFTGVRFDLNGSKNKSTFFYSRGSGDRDRFSIFTPGQDERSPVVLWGLHWETQIGSALRLGSTFVNQHLTDTRSQTGSIFRGNISNAMMPPSRVVVRVVDDSPDDESASALVYAVDIVVRGQDLQGNEKILTSSSQSAGEQIEWDPQLVPVAEGRSVGNHWQAAGPDEMVEFSFALPEGFISRQAEFTAQVAGDYRIQVRQEHSHEYTRIIAGRSRLRTKDMQWPAPARRSPVEAAGFDGDAGDLKYPRDFKFPELVPAYTVLRSPGTPRDLEPKIVRFEYGFPTAQSLASLSLDFDHAGFKIKSEAAFNVQDFKYPFQEGTRHHKNASAYFLTAERKVPLLGPRAPRWGLELYRIDPDYSGNYDSRRGGAIFHTDVPIAPPNTNITQEFNLFDDNDDGDQWPDDMPDDTPLAGQNDAGVFPGLDANNDNVPDTDQNGNGIADWDEPFLFFWADPPQFIYDIDMNNNGLPDLTENDDRPDYPYKRDQQGVHTFIDLASWTPFFDKLSLGFYRSKEIAGEGKSRASYLRWETRYSQAKWGFIDFLGDIKRVEDSIADPTFIWRTSTNLRINSIVLQETSGQYNLIDLRDPDPDPLLMRKSTVGTVFLNSEFARGEQLELSLRYKWQLNRQHQGVFADDTMQQDRTLSRLTMSHRLQYRYALLDNITLTARLRHLYWQDSGYAVSMRQHWSTYGPLFEQEFKLTDRTVLVAGQEGIPGLVPVRHREHNSTQSDFDRWVDVFMLRTQSSYLGWNTVMELGVQYEKKVSADEALTNRTFFIEMFFGF